MSEGSRDRADVLVEARALVERRRVACEAEARAGVPFYARNEEDRRLSAERRDAHLALVDAAERLLLALCDELAAARRARDAALTYRDAWRAFDRTDAAINAGVRDDLSAEQMQPLWDADAAARKKRARAHDALMELPDDECAALDVCAEVPT